MRINSIFCNLVSGYEIINLRIKTGIAPFNQNRDVFLRIFISYFSYYFVCMVIMVLKRKYNFVLRIILNTEAFEVIEQIVVKSLERF